MGSTSITAPPPQYVQPAPDPQFQALQVQSENDQIAATRETAQMDTASLMARYGTRLAMASATGTSPGASPLLPAASAAPRFDPSGNMAAIFANAAFGGR